MTNSEIAYRSASATIAEWAYFAGIFDGEGCIRVLFSQYRQIGRRKNTWSMSLDLCNTHYPVLEWVRSTFGGYIYSEERPKGEYRRRFHWRISNSPDMVILLNGMLPFLVIKKPQAEIAVAYLRKVRPKNMGGGKVNMLAEDDLKERAELCKQLRAIRWKEWPAIPLKSKTMATCGCGARFLRKGIHHVNCSARCGSRFSARKMRAEGRLSKQNESHGDLEASTLGA